MGKGTDRKIMCVDNIEIWYHDPAEADPQYSWLANSEVLTSCHQDSFDRCPYSRVLALAEYAQPDIVLSCDGAPILSMELTRMNPSGHNLPQRFSCLVRAAELGIPSVLYHLEYARRASSDPNPRYLNIRTPLAQLRMADLYKVPSVSIIWPTNPETLDAQTGVEAHRHLADFVEFAANSALAGTMLRNTDRLVVDCYENMRTISREYLDRYVPNASYRSYIPEGDTFTTQIIGTPVDPPGSCELIRTRDLLNEVFKGRIPRNRKTGFLLSREYSIVYTGTPNKSKDGPEHPYPGYLTLIDILYCRQPNGQNPRDRRYNLVFKLPISLQVFERKALDRPTGLNILMEFSDLILFSDAAAVGGFIRNLGAGIVISRG